MVEAIMMKDWLYVLIFLIWKQINNYISVALDDDIGTGYHPIASWISLEGIHTLAKLMHNFSSQQPEFASSFANLLVMTAYYGKAKKWRLFHFSIYLKLSIFLLL